jgi:hypothetical protein
MRSANSRALITQAFTYEESEREISIMQPDDSSRIHPRPWIRNDRDYAETMKQHILSNARVSFPENPSVFPETR